MNKLEVLKIAIEIVNRWGYADLKNIKSVYVELINILNNE